VHLNKNNRGNGNEGLRKALVDAKKNKAEMILFGGDNVETDALKDAEQTADSLHRRFKNIVSECGLPAHFTIGNHDRYYLNNGSEDKLGFNLFEKYFGPTYYSFTQKGVHFIILNSLYPTKDSPYSIDDVQLEWLKNDLQAIGKTTPIVVSLHVPMLSLYYPVVEGNFKGSDMISNSKKVFEVLNEYNVKLILQGHQHIYEQIQERYRWFVTGGAVSAYWWGGHFLETKEGYLLVHVNSNGDFNWKYMTYGWNAKKNN
jgi:3',5'-cyclic AMP phosphodiesterase CpdA